MWLDGINSKYKLKALIGLFFLWCSQKTLYAIRNPTISSIEYYKNSKGQEWQFNPNFPNWIKTKI